MDQNFHLQHSPANSASSAIDLTTTSAGLARSVPPSPSLDPLDGENSFARRRQSWSNRFLDPGQDPLRLDLSDSVLQASPSPGRYEGSHPAVPTSEDPFYSSDDNSPVARGSSDNMFSTSQIIPSSTSLAVPQHDMDLDDGSREDDEAHLTANVSYGGVDPEYSGGLTPRSRRRTIRYSSTPSPLKRTGSAIKSVSKSLRRVSVRVVNLPGSEPEGQQRANDTPDAAQDILSPGSEPEGIVEQIPLQDSRKPSPIRGRTLGYLGPDSGLRMALYKFLLNPWTEPIILLLILLNAIVLTIQAFPSLTLPTSDDAPVLPPRVKGYFHTWEDSVLFILFVIFTLEAFARICVSGFLFDPDVRMSSLFLPPDPATSPVTANSGVSRQTSLARARSITDRIRTIHSTLTRPFTLSSRRRQNYAFSNGISNASTSFPASNNYPEKLVNVSETVHNAIRDHPQSTFLSKAMKSDDTEGISLPFSLNISDLHEKAQRNLPYLRHSWSRIDFVAIVSFWIAFLLSSSGLERGEHHIGLFRAMSVIRTARLLSVTSGTTTIMHSLKTARPLLTSVAYFVLFAMVLFSIIGVQSFKGSLRRTCVLGPTLGEGETLLDGQFCGGHIDPVTLGVTGFIQLSGTTVPSTKGYICPLGQVCKELNNPKDNIESFDAIYYAALQVIIVASANGWAPLMYSMIDAEFFVSSIFFIACVIILNFWLINLFVAVITNTFSAIRRETSKSAFGAAPLVPSDNENDGDWAVINSRKPFSRRNLAKIIYAHTRWCWVLLALASLALQATRTVDVSETHEQAMYYGELGITIAFDFEILLRVLATLPAWRTFFHAGQNWIDTILAITSTIIQIPVIQNSAIYPWFTIFQLARFYRVILEVPRMRPLLLAVFGNMYGLANMSLFLIMVNYIAALVAVQLLRGDFGDETTVNFGGLWNSFLAMYQVFSSENWTDVLYGATNAELRLGQTVIIIVFIASWMLFANFIMLQMFIAVINENFDVAEEAKKIKQASKYWEAQKSHERKPSWTTRLNPYRWIKPTGVQRGNLPSDLSLPMQTTLLQSDTAASSRSDVQGSITDYNDNKYKPRHQASKSLTTLEKLFAGEARSDDIPMTNLRQAKMMAASEDHDEQLQRRLRVLATVNPEVANPDDAVKRDRRARKATFIREHPSYDKTFWIISQDNFTRRMCQKVVQPAKGERIFGTPYSQIAHPVFQLIILMTVIGGIIVEGIATPSYRRNYYLQHGFIRGAWFDIAEAAFGFSLFVEFLIKIIADGFIFTPNAYLQSIWNILDFLIMFGIIVNVSTGLIWVGGISRFTRSLKALRALRLITLIDRMRNTFQSLIISGALRIIDAAVLAILYMIPYAVWGLNIFAGKLNSCNDDGVSGISDCINEYPNTVYGDSFAFPIPRVWDNPSPSTTFSFDSFKSSLLILFEIVSLEGWTDVMGVATSVTGPGLQPQTNATQANAIFFLIYNLLGGVVILTLFVSIIIGNFSSKTGSAFLTKPQREWIDLQKLFKRQRPSKRPPTRPTGTIRGWCFDRAVQKHGWWSRVMTILFILHIFALMTQTFSIHGVADAIRNDFFLALMFIYIIDVVVRFYGLGWRSFHANGWNIFDIIVAIGSFITTLIVRFGTSSQINNVTQLQKLFLVSIAFKLVQRTDSLNMLFKTAVASLPVILSLLGLWFILFVFFAILFTEVFGLTKWSVAETRSRNYSTLGSALVMLAFQSTGEGWNQFMHDFDLTYPRCTNDLETDCGSTGWAFSLFIAWNLLSMYIFVNMFTGVVVENFSYVFQASGSGSKSISREQMRTFKKVWSELANPKTGYLERHRFAKFFSRLSGAFEVRIYPPQYNASKIAAACRVDPDCEQIWPTRNMYGIDVNRMEEILDQVDYKMIRKRKATYTRLYHEASISYRQGLGISFTGMLLLLAHHKVIVEEEALVMKNLIARKETNKLVTELINLDRVRSLMIGITDRKNFLAHMKKVRAARFEQADIPSIVVETTPETPTMPSRDIASIIYDNSAPNSPSPTKHRFSRGSYAVSLDSRYKHKGKQASDVGSFSVDLGSKSPLSDDEQHDIVSASQQSPGWKGLV